ncbi:MAG: NmrA family transcriptional regulator [Citrobacter freundii]|nr:MAG: NmrA family transcriptional regulator [Citrobacter freundii]
MKIVVIGGTGLIGSKVVSRLRQLGHDVVVGSPQTGVNTLTGEGLAKALADTDIVIDLANSPSFEDRAVMDFFEKSGKNLLAAGTNAGVKHHVALSVVGTDRLQQSAYFRAKQKQEELIVKSAIPYTIIHSTQFMEFLGGIVASAHEGDAIRLSNAKIQPIAADDVAAFVVEFLLGDPVNGIVEIGGPERFGLADLVRLYLSRKADKRDVITDETALYFGAHLDDLTLIPDNDAKTGRINFDTWMTAQLQKA